MVSTRKKKQQIKKLFSQLSEVYTGFVIGQSNHRVQTESRDNMTYRGTSWDNQNNPTQMNYAQVDMPSFEETLVSKVRSEVDGVMITHKAGLDSVVQDTVLTAIEKLVIPRVELAMKSANASSGRTVDSNVLEPDQRDFLGNIEGLQMTASSRIISRTDLNKIDETRGEITAEGGDLWSTKRTLTGKHTLTTACFFNKNFWLFLVTWLCFLYKPSSAIYYDGSITGTNLLYDIVSVLWVVPG